MIKILITKEENQFKAIEIKGHANAGIHGEDLVCAGVSSIVTGAFNALHDIKNFKVELKEGYASLEAIKPVSSHDAVVIETLIISLRTIEEGNSKYIKINEN